MEKRWKAAKEILLAGTAGAIFYLFAAAVFAVIVRAYAPPQTVVTAVNWTFKALASLAFSLLFVRKGRAIWKGAAAGVFSCLLSLLLFAAIGGGFRITALFPLELVLAALFGGIGAILGVKLRKEE